MSETVTIKEQIRAIKDVALFVYPELVDQNRAIQAAIASLGILEETIRQYELLAEELVDVRRDKEVLQQRIVNLQREVDELRKYGPDVEEAIEEQNRIQRGFSNTDQ